MGKSLLAVRLAIKYVMSTIHVDFEVLQYISILLYADLTVYLKPVTFWCETRYRRDTQVTCHCKCTLAYD